VAQRLDSCMMMMMMMMMHIFKHLVKMVYPLGALSLYKKPFGLLFFSLTYFHLLLFDLHIS
jgi:hypothetical protein